MHHIVILGGGFAGVGATLKVKQLARHHKITIIDRHSYQLFYPSLYEVATSEEPQKNIAFPLSEIAGENITVLKGTIEKIDPAAKHIRLSDGLTIPFDYLLIAVGSQPAYYHIPGLQEHSIPLKTIKDALTIKKKITSMYCTEAEHHRHLRVVIGGGGFTGTELAAELVYYKDRLAKEHHLGNDCMDMTIIQGSDKLLKELDTHVSSLAMKRMSLPQVTFAFGGHIKEVTASEVLTDDGKSYPYDILIWTGGIEPSKLPTNSGLPVDKHGALVVNDKLQVQGFEHIFAAGDVAGFIDPKTQKPVPNVAQVAEEQGHIAGENIVLAIENKPLRSYTYRHFGYVVPLRGRFAAAELMGGFHLDGILGWGLQQLVLLRYLLGILPLHKAMMKWNTFEMELEK